MKLLNSLIGFTQGEETVRSTGEPVTLGYLGCVGGPATLGYLGRDVTT